MIPKENLTGLDYEILQFIAEHSPVLKTDVLKAFPQSTTEIRLSEFATPKYRFINGIQIPVENTRYISLALSMEPSRTEIGILPLGQKLVEEYQYQKKLVQKEKTENRLWKLAPIVISLCSLILSIISLYFTYQARL